MGIIALLTDFGTKDGYVASMKAVMTTICSRASIIDISHDISPQHIAEGRFVLWTTYRFFPPGTIFVCVVDPGVGTSREILAVKTAHYIFMAPDNGLLDMVLSETQISASYSVINKEYFLTTISSTFHGRDIFSPVAAHLCNGISLESIGTPITVNPSSGFISEIFDSGSYDGSIIYIDHFGNLVTNFRMDSILQSHLENVTIVLRSKTISLRKTYGEANEGELFALTGSSGLVEIAVRNGSAHRRFAAGYGSRVELHVS